MIFSAARRAFKSVEKVQAASRRFLVSRRYPQLATLHIRLIHNSSDVPTLTLETQDLDVTSGTNDDEFDSVPSPIAKSLPSIPNSFVPPTCQTPAVQPISPLSIPHSDRPELAIIDLTPQIRSTEKVNAQLVIHIHTLETRIADWQARASNVEALVKERECIIGDSVPLPLYEREQEAVLQLREKFESSIAHEAASKGHLMQVRGRVQSRAKFLEANRARESKCSTSPQDAERALREAIVRVKVFLQVKSSQPRPRGGELLSHDEGNEASVRPTFIKLNRSCRSPFAPTKPPLPKLLTRDDLASSLPQPPPDENVRPTGRGLSVPPSTATSSSVWKNTGNRRLSVPVADNSFVHDRASVNKRLAAFYASRSSPSPPSEMRHPKLLPNSLKTTDSSPAPSSSQQSRIRSTVEGEDKLPSWVEEMLDHIAHPLHHHRLASTDLSKSILSKRSSSISSVDNLHLSLQVPSPSPTRSEWELVGDNETLGGSKVNLLSMVEASPAKTIRPAVSLGRPPKSPALPQPQESKPSSAHSSTGWLKNVANKIGHPSSERARGKKGSTMSRI